MPETATTCRRCDSPLETFEATSGVCTDETCPYFSHPQWMDYEFMAEHTSDEVSAAIDEREGPDASAAYDRADAR
jgi:hypothetical protein